MKYITPYKSLDEATTSLDNGGRFYNFLTTEEDGIISSAEVGKVAGLFNDRQKMILYLAMCFSKLNASARRQIESSLSEELKTSYQKYFPQYLLPSEAKELGKLSSNAIITGIPVYIDSKKDFNGFIIVPVMVGTVMTMMLIPIIDRYDVYHLKDQSTSETFLIAHARSKEKLPQQILSVGGNLKELKLKKDTRGPGELFLEVVYYADVQISE
ncbi:MAG TPA: hypothetical protein VLO29_08285 [Salegentibacter sp.]|nr:hypothetical protein [Salegentibacter sp.]